MHDDIRIRVVSNKSVSNSSSFVDDNSRTNISWILTALVSRGVDEEVWQFHSDRREERHASIDI